MKRVNVYIDGFNFYHSLLNKIDDKNSGFTNEFKRCNFKKLSELYLEDGEQINEVYFFTAYPTWDRDKTERHKTYVRALQKFGVRSIIGKFKTVERKFTNKMRVIEFLLNLVLSEKEKMKYLPKRLRYHTYEEKETDVNIAVKIVEDAFKDNYDKAVILSGDSDIIPAIESVKKTFRDKEFLSLLLTGAKGKVIQNVCINKKIISYTDVKNSLLPKKIKISQGIIIEKPKSWI